MTMKALLVSFLPHLHGAVDWSVLFVCGIYWSYSLTFSDHQLTLESNLKVKNTHIQIHHILCNTISSISFRWRVFGPCLRNSVFGVVPKLAWSPNLNNMLLFTHHRKALKYERRQLKTEDVQVIGKTN